MTDDATLDALIAERAQWRRAVEAAYREGHLEGSCYTEQEYASEAVDTDWQKSDAASGDPARWGRWIVK